MRGQDLTQETKQGLAAANKRAFDDILGDPFAKPEPLNGNYQILKSRGAAATMQNNFDEAVSTRNPATPNVIDFFCDVERIVKETLTTAELRKFEDAYIYETPTKDGFTQGERSEIEQRLGRMFRANSISPISKYFTSIRRNTSNDRRNLNGTRSSNASSHGSSTGIA